MRIIVATLLLTGIVLPTVSAAKEEDRFGVPQNVQAVLAQRCLDCHGADAAEGDVRLDALAKLGQDERLELLNRAQEQLFFGQMPPEDEEQPEQRYCVADVQCAVLVEVSDVQRCNRHTAISASKMAIKKGCVPGCGSPYHRAAADKARQQ